MPLHSKEIVINECDKKSAMGYRTPSQVHDGFATIRSRGQQRNRMRIKQMEAINSSFNKCDSMPIYEDSTSSNSNPCSIGRNKSRQSAIEIDRLVLCRSTNNLPNEQYLSSNTCYENALNALELAPNVSAHGVSDNNYFLYARPASPTGHIVRPSIIEADGLYARNDMKNRLPPPYDFTKPNLQYRKSLSNSSQLVYESNYYNPDTNYYDPNKISYNNLSDIHKSSAKSSDNLNSDVESIISFEPSGCERQRYATMSHPRDTQHYHNLQHQRLHGKYVRNQFSASQTDVEYIDPIDYKVGCQTTLRSKPQIPWYELAIKKSNRRLSCPPMQVNSRLNTLPNVRIHTKLADAKYHKLNHFLVSFSDFLGSFESGVWTKHRKSDAETATCVGAKWQQRQRYYGNATKNWANA